MTTLLPPVCFRCVHFDSMNEDGMTCRAFPDGIPTTIVMGKNDHTNPVPGDHGKQFTPGTPHDAEITPIPNPI